MKEGEQLTYNDKPLRLFDLDYTEMVYIEKGNFIMGDNSSKYENEKPEVEISFISGFYTGKYAVTQELYEFVMGENPAFFKGKHRPVESISFDDICKGDQSFLAILNTKIKRRYPDLEGKFELLSEAQWEYAARGGKRWNKPKLIHAGSLNIEIVAWCEKKITTMPVGLLEPNELGIHDFNGNVWEWCADWYNNSLIRKPKNGRPSHKRGITLRVSRGGCYLDSYNNCRVSSRRTDNPGNRSRCIGFRLVFNL